MKNFKTILAVILAVASLSVSLISCGKGSIQKGSATAKATASAAVTDVNTEASSNAAESTTGEVKKPVSEGQLAADCLVAIMVATDAEQIKPYLTEDSLGKAENLVDAYPGTEYEVSVKPAGSYKEYKVFTYIAKALKGSDQEESGMSLFLITDKGCVLCIDDDVISGFRKDNLCGTCGGAGSIQSGGNTCGICGGTGQQYFPNVYFDAALNMWQGQWQACGGCGGAGNTGAVSNTCSSCHGYGIIIK